MKYKVILTSLSILGACFGSCSDDNSEEQGVYDSQLNICVVEDDIAVDFGPISEINNQDIEISCMTEERAMSRLKELSESENGNFMYSPIASTISYAMMMNTSEGKSQDDIKRYIGISDDISTESANEYCRKLIAELNQKEATSQEETRISAKMWVNEQSKIYSSFISILASYSADIMGVDFNKSTDINKINNEISESSNYDNAAILQDSWDGTNSIITNSICFKKRWNIGFSQKNGNFINIDGDSISCGLLKYTGKLYYRESELYSIIQLPYRDTDYSMYIVCPKESTGTTSAISSIISQGGIDREIGQMDTTYVQFSMPEFAVENTLSLIPKDKYSGEYEYLKCYSKVSPDQFVLNEIYQVCQIKVDKTGTSVEVQSGTGNGSTVHTSPSIKPVEGPSIQPIIVDVNKPFWFIIRNDKFKNTLFAGQVRTI